MIESEGGHNSVTFKGLVKDLRMKLFNLLNCHPSGQSQFEKQIRELDNELERSGANGIEITEQGDITYFDKEGNKINPPQSS